MSKLPTEAPFSAYVANLPYEVSEYDIAEFFGEDTVDSIHIPLDKKTNKIFGTAFVHFFNLEGLKKALEKNGQKLMERQLRVDILERKERSKKEYKSDRPRKDFGEKKEFVEKPRYSDSIEPPTGARRPRDTAHS